jgi:hypothetical protein
VSSDPSLLLEDIFLGAAPRAFDNLPVQIWRFSNPPYMFLMNNSRLKSWQLSVCHFVSRFWKSFSKFKSFHFVSPSRFSISFFHSIPLFRFSKVLFWQNILFQGEP